MKLCPNPDCSAGYIEFIEDAYICHVCDGLGEIPDDSTSEGWVEAFVKEYYG